MTVAPVIARVILNLNATSAADLMFWSDTELYSWLSEALMGMARRIQLFAEERSIDPAAAQAIQNLNARDLAVMHLAWDTRSLMPITLAELDSLNEEWATTAADVAAPPKYFAPDYQGLAYVWLYPPPAADAAMHTITLRLPAVVTAASPTIAAPEVLGDVLEARTLQAARERQGDGAMPDVAAAMGAFADMLAGVLRSYYGGSQ